MRDFSKKMSANRFAFSEAVVAQLPLWAFSGVMVSALLPADMRGLEMFHHFLEDGFKLENFARVRRMKAL